MLVPILFLSLNCYWIHIQESKNISLHVSLNTILDIFLNILIICEMIKGKVWKEADIYIRIEEIWKY